MILSLLLAVDENYVIGKNNQLPWYLPNDLKYFKNKTWGLPVLMGRKTFESIGKPMPGRKNIVITHDRGWKADGIIVVNTIESAIEKAKEQGANEIFIIGGAQIFNSTFHKADRIYLTRIHHQFEGDAYFPEIRTDEWELIQNHFCPADEKNLYSHSFQVWEKRKAG